MTTNVLLLLQSILTGLQVLNALLATEHPPAWLTISIAVFIAAIQNYVQHAGNEAIPKRLVEADQLRKALSPAESADARPPHLRYRAPGANLAPDPPEER